MKSQSSNITQRKGDHKPVKQTTGLFNEELKQEKVKSI